MVLRSPVRNRDFLAPVLSRLESVSIKKRLLIIIAVASLIILLTGGTLVVYRVKQALLVARKFRKRPDELKTATIVEGAGRFSKEVLFTKADLGVITDFEQIPDHELVVVGQKGAAFLDNNHLLNRSVTFEKCDSDVTSVNVGTGVFLCRGTWNTNTALFDAGGKTLWSYGGGMNGIDDAAAGTLGPDALKRIVVGFNGDGGIRLLNSEGKELWKKDDGNVWHIEIAAAADKSGNVILHSNARGQLTVRDANGDVLGLYKPEIYLASFSMTRWREDPNVNKLVASEEGSVYIIDDKGKTLARLPAPGSAPMAQTKSASVNLSPDIPFFAVLLRYFLWNRSLLYIYNGQAQLVYHEVLDHDCDAVRASTERNGIEDLLLGCEGAVWKYSLLDPLHAARAPNQLHSDEAVQ